MSTSRVESERPGPRLQNSLLAAVDSDRGQQRPEEHQDCPPTRTLCPCVWRVSTCTFTNYSLRFHWDVFLFFCLKMQIQENFEHSDCVAAAWIWDHLVIYLALSTKGLTSLCTHHFYPFIFSLIISLYFSSALQVADRTLSRPRPEGCCQGNRRPAAPRGEEIRGKSPLYDPCLSILTDCCCVWMLLFRYGTPRASGRASTWPLSTDMAECTTTVRRMSQQDQQHETDHTNMYSIDKYVTYCASALLCVHVPICFLCVRVCFQPSLAVCPGRSVRTNCCM